MLLHEVFQHILLLLLLARRLPLPLHLLVIHHLLDHASSLTVQVAQFRVLGLDLCDIYLRSCCNNVSPPLGFVLFVQMNGYFFARGSCFEGPGAFVEDNWMGKVALSNHVSAHDPAMYCESSLNHR